MTFFPSSQFLQLKDELKAGLRRADAVGSELNDVAQTLSRRRSELDYLRRGMFEQFGSGQNGHLSDPPPVFDAPSAEIATPVPMGWGSSESLDPVWNKLRQDNLTWN
jgi:hypothetical protein